MQFSFTNILASLRQKAAGAPSRMVGIDIGGSSIKVVELEETERAVTLRTYGELQLGPYAESDLGQAVVLQEDKRIEALVDVLRESQVEATDGVLAMPLSSSFVTVIPVTMGSNEDLASKIPIEARKYIPVPLPEVSLDWTELEHHGMTDSTIHEVLLAAIQTESLTSFERIMNAIKLHSQGSEIEVFSTIRALHKPQATTMGIIDLGARVSKLYITHNGALERIHRVSVGGSSVTDKLHTLLNISYTEAENVKRNTTATSEHVAEVKKVTHATLEGPLQEFKRIIDQYEARFSLTLDSIVVVGGVARTQGIQAFAQDVLGKSISVPHSFEQVAYPAFMEDTLKALGPSFTVAIGAALRGFRG